MATKKINIRLRSDMHDWLLDFAYEHDMNLTQAIHYLLQREREVLVTQETIRRASKKALDNPS